MVCHIVVRRVPRQILEPEFHNNAVLPDFVQRTSPIRDWFVQFAALTLTTIDRCSSANCTKEFLIGAVRRTAPVTMLLSDANL